MTDLIKREDAIKALTEVLFDEPPYLNSIEKCETFARKTLESIPSAEPKQGKWIHDRLEADGAKLPDLFLPLCQCSECAIYVQYESNYCPNCGARMKGVDE